MGRQQLILGGGGAIGAALVVAFLLMPGFDSYDGHPPYALYSSRTDPLVIDAAKANPPEALYAVGKLDESIAGLRERGGHIVLPSEIPDRTRNEIDKAVIELFGTPAAPTIGTSKEFDPAALAAGSQVYKKRCIDCHGLNGDGRGPTSLWVVPPARDFRQAQFKLVSTASGLGWPSRDDLHRVIRRGVEGAAMQPYAFLPDADIASVAEYVMHLTLRGKVEFELLKAYSSDDPPENAKVFAEKALANAVAQWHAAGEVKAEPREIAGDDVRIREGHALFTSDATGCAKCHVNYGRDSQWRYDAWGITVKPPDLTKGAPRGGREPLDYFHRIRSGIVPSGMPPSSLSDDDVWKLVAFLKALPDPRHLPKDVRKTVYPEVP